MSEAKRLENKAYRLIAILAITVILAQAYPTLFTLLLAVSMGVIAGYAICEYSNAVDTDVKVKRNRDYYGHE